MTDQRPPLSNMPHFAFAISERETPRIAERTAEIYAEAVAAGLNEGRERAQVMNDALSILAHLAATQILSVVDQFMDSKARNLDPNIAFAIMWQDIGKRARHILDQANIRALAAAAANEGGSDGR